MKVILFISISIQLLIFSCEPSLKQSKPIIESGTLKVCSEKFIIDTSNGQFHYLASLKNDTILKNQDYYHSVDFSDINNDGCIDIKVNLISNTDAFDIYLFDNVTKSFRLVNNLYAEPVAISNSGYYYFYEATGCADYNWRSVLFRIKNFDLIRLGEIRGSGCENDEERDEIIVLIVDKWGIESVIQKFSIDTIETFDDNKWGFINSYWANHYLNFAN